MDLGSGYPFWLIKSGLLNTYPFLEKNIKTDVIIIGGGISGALMAYRLVNAGVDCVLIDRRSIGLGSTCASTSLLQYEIDTPLCRLVKIIGEKPAVTAYKLCSDAIDEIEQIGQKIHFKEFERRQSLYFAALKKDIPFLREEFKVRKENGFDVSFLTEETIRNKFSFSSAAAILSPQGAQANVYEFTHQLLQYAIKKGLQVYDRTEAAHISYAANKVKVTTEKGFYITAGKVVYATGYESVKYIDGRFVKLKSTYALCSEQMNEKYLKKLSKTIFWNTADPYFYMRLTNDNRILIGGRDEDFFNPARRDKLLRGKVKKLTGDFKKLLPEIPFTPEFSWTGTFSATKDGLPFIGSYKKRKNCYFSLGFGGNGITFSLIGANIITDLITGKKNKHSQLFSFDRV